MRQASSSQHAGLCARAPSTGRRCARLRAVVGRGVGCVQARVRLGRRRALPRSGVVARPPLADLAYEEAFTQDVSRLEEMRWTCLEDRIDADLAAERSCGAIADLEDLTHSLPVTRAGVRTADAGVYRSGRQADALHAYRRMRATLVGDLGLEPSRALANLSARSCNRSCPRRGGRRAGPTPSGRPSLPDADDHGRRWCGSAA